MKTRLTLTIILLVAAVLRLYQLGAIPGILNPDEASIGYNAYLLKETGKDEWQKSWPVVLDAFGDQKVFGYPLLVVLTFVIGGVSDTTVRLPAALAGIVLVYLGYEFSRAQKRSVTEQLLFATVICFLPVFIFYSRIAFEAMVALDLVVASLILLYKNEQGKNLLMDVLAAVLFFLAVFFYNSPLLLIPFVAVTVALHRGVLRFRQWGVAVGSLVIAFMMSLFILLPLTQQKGKITVFQDETYQLQANEYRVSLPKPLQPLLGNKYLYFSAIAVAQATKSFSPSFELFNAGGHPWHSIPGTGYLFATIYGMGLLGIIFTVWEVAQKKLEILKKKPKKLFQVIFNNSEITQRSAILFLFLTSLVPSAITVNAPQTTRSLLFLFLWGYFAVYGFEQLRKWLKTRSLQLSHVFVVAIGILFIVEAGIYIGNYFGKYAYSSTLQSTFKPGYQHIIQEIEQKYPTAKVVVVDNRGFQYILTAWYAHLTPEVFYSTIVKQLPDKINFKYGERVGRYHFVGHATDRTSAEIIVVEWNDAQQKWNMTMF